MQSGVGGWRAAEIIILRSLVVAVPTIGAFSALKSRVEVGTGTIFAAAA